MTPLLLFWPFWLVLVSMLASCFAGEPSLYSAGLLFLWTIVGCVQALNTWREVQIVAREWMKEKKG